MGRNPLWYREYGRKALKEMAFDKYVESLKGKPSLTAKDKDKFYKDAFEYLTYKGVYECRDIATRLGLPATTLTKDELNHRIVAAMWGLQDFDDVESMLVEPSVNSRISPAVELKIDELYRKGAFINGREVRGYFEKTDGGYGVIRAFPLGKCDSDAFCAVKLVNELGLKDGDFIVARVKYEEELKCMYVYHVDNINGVDVDDFNKPLAGVNDLAMQDPVRRLVVPDTADGLGGYVNVLAPLAIGQNLLVSYSGTPTGPDNVIGLADALRETAEFDNVVTVFLGEREKNRQKVRALSGDDGFVTAGDDERAAYVAKRATDFVKGEARRGKNVCLLVNALYPIAWKDGLCEYIMSSAVSYARGGSVTVVCFVDREAVGGGYDKVKRIADAELHLDYYAFLDLFDVDVSDSYSVCSSLLEGTDKHVTTVLRRFLRERGAAAARRLVSSQKSYKALCDAVLAVETYERDEMFTR